MSKIQNQLPAKRPLLSFSDEEEESFPAKKQFGRDPVADSLTAMKSSQRMESENLPELKSQKITVNFRFWDGTNNNYTMQVTKGTKIGDFLFKAKEVLQKDFPQLRKVHSAGLLYVKEKKIVPHDYKFYEVMSLFEMKFEQDKEVDNGCPGKILERKWYEKNKHIFPASCWEIYEKA